MNKYKEAKETLEKYDYSTKLELSEGIRNNITSGITVEQFFMMKKTCIELLDKAKPKKARADSVGCYCGNCAYRLGDNNGWTQATVKYCGNCGHKIEWRK